MMLPGDLSLVLSSDKGSLGAISWSWVLFEEGAFSSERIDGCTGSGGGELGVVVVESGVSDFGSA